MSELDPNLSAPSGSDIPAIPATPAIQGTPAEPTATPSAAPAGATPSVPVTHSPQDQSGMVPSYRLRETREAVLREAEGRIRELQSQYDQRIQMMEARMRALAGLEPDPDPNITEVRQRFASLFPSLAKLEERYGDIEKLIERAGDLETVTSHHWNTYARQTTDRLFSLAQDAYGHPLSDEAKRHLSASFIGFVQSSPDMSRRYIEDPSIVDDFFKAFSSNFIDPIKRTSTAAVATRASVPVPRDDPGGVPRATPIEKPANLDDRVGRAWTAFNKVREV